MGDPAVEHIAAVFAAAFGGDKLRVHRALRELPDTDVQRLADAAELIRRAAARRLRVPREEPAGWWHPVPGEAPYPRRDRPDFPLV